MSHFFRNPTTDFYTKHAINFEAGIGCRLKCRVCFRNYNPKELKLKTRTNIPFETFEPILSNFQWISFCGNMSDPIYHPDFVKSIEYAVSLNKKIQVHTNGSGKTKKWWTHLFNVTKNYNKCEWIFGIDGLPKDSHKYRVNQDGEQVWEMAKLGASMGCNVKWQFIIFDYNKNDIETCRKMAEKHNIEFYVRPDKSSEEERPNVREQNERDSS